MPAVIDEGRKVFVTSYRMPALWNSLSPSDQYRLLELAFHEGRHADRRIWGANAADGPRIQQLSSEIAEAVCKSFQGFPRVRSKQK